MDPAPALAAAGRGAALSHERAALVHGIELLDAPVDRLTVPRDRSRRLVPGWQVLRRDLPGGDVEVVDGLLVTTALRTLLDLSLVLPVVAAVVAGDSALRRRLVTAADVAGRLGSSAGRGASRPRAVARLLDPLSGSVLETLLRLLLAQLAVPPVAQHEVRDRFGRFVARVDFAWPDARLVVEADGFAFHSDRAAYRRDRERLNELELLGWRVLRFTWEDVVSRPDHVLALVRACLAQAA